jgi:hypothetical protein
MVATGARSPPTGESARVKPLASLGRSLAPAGVARRAQAGEARIAQVIKAAGFTRVRRATETPFNLTDTATR